jgi:thiamine-phosphate pyrophosphorylase
VLVHLRDRELPFRERYALGVRLRAITAGTAQRLIINDRADLALLLDADGVHLPEAALRAEEVRPLFAERARAPWLSRAWHGQGPIDAEVNALLIAPVFAARKGRPALGLFGLRALLPALPPEVVAFALGGVCAANAPLCLEAGASGIAVIAAAYSEAERLISALHLSRTQNDR